MWHFHFNLRDFYTICMQTHIYTFTLPSLQCKWHHIFNMFNKTRILFIWCSPLNCGKDGWYVETLFCNIWNYAKQYTRYFVFSYLKIATFLLRIITRKTPTFYGFQTVVAQLLTAENAILHICSLPPNQLSTQRCIPPETVTAESCILHLVLMEIKIFVWSWFMTRKPFHVFHLLPASGARAVPWC